MDVREERECAVEHSLLRRSSVRLSFVIGSSSFCPFPVFSLRSRSTRRCGSLRALRFCPDPSGSGPVRCSLGLSRSGGSRGSRLDNGRLLLHPPGYARSVPRRKVSFQDLHDRLRFEITLFGCEKTQFAPYLRREIFLVKSVGYVDRRSLQDISPQIILDKWDRFTAIARRWGHHPKYCFGSGTKHTRCRLEERRSELVNLPPKPSTNGSIRAELNLLKTLFQHPHQQFYNYIGLTKPSCWGCHEFMTAVNNIQGTKFKSMDSPHRNWDSSWRFPELPFPRFPDIATQMMNNTWRTFAWKYLRFCPFPGTPLQGSERFSETWEGSSWDDEASGSGWNLF